MKLTEREQNILDNWSLLSESNKERLKSIGISQNGK